MGFENTAIQQDLEKDSGARAEPPVAVDRGKKSAGAFRTISEVADELDVQQHVLRFWETKFSQIRPLKRGGGRRYYRPEDVALLKKIHELLYTQGYTIKGVQKLLRQNGKNALLQADFSVGAGIVGKADAAANAADNAPGKDAAGLNPEQITLLESTLIELKDLRRLVTVL